MKIQRADMPLRKIALFLILLLSLISFKVYASGKLSMDSPEVDSIILRGLHLVHADSTHEAVEQFKKLIDIFPQDPIGYFYVSASLQTMMDDFRNYSYLDEFNRYMNLAIQTAEEKKKKGNLSAYDYLYLGGAVGYRGIHKALTGNWFGAFVDGLKGKGYLEKALKLDPELYDVYYGLGTYHFWKSLKSKIFWWLPFVADKRQMGIDMIKLAIEKGKYAKEDAKFALVRIWVENKEYEKAFNMINKLQKKHPNKPFLLWFLGQVQLETGMYDEAVNTYLALLEALTSSPYYHPAGEVECRFFLARAYYEKKEFEKCSAQIDSILSFGKEAKRNKSIKEFIGKAKELKKRIRKESNTG